MYGIINFTNWNATTNYLAGKDFVIRNSLVYKCTIDNAGLDPATNANQWGLYTTTTGPGTAGINYVPNSTAESGVSNWTAYNDKGAAILITSAAIVANEITTNIAHGYAIGDSVYLSGVGGITGLSANVRYYVASKSTTTKVGFAATRGGDIIACSAASITGSPSIFKTSVVNGIGGTPGITFATTTTTPLRQTKSFLLTTANGTAGHGVATDTFTIDNSELGRVGSISFDLRNTSSSQATINSGDLEVWLFDVTNSVLIQPSPTSVGAMAYSATSLNYSYFASFQFPTNSVQYRLIIHWNNPSTSIFSIMMDNFIVGPLVKTILPEISHQVTTYNGTVSASGFNPLYATNIADGVSNYFADTAIPLIGGKQYDQLVSMTFSGRLSNGNGTGAQSGMAFKVRDGGVAGTVLAEVTAPYNYQLSEMDYTVASSVVFAVPYPSTGLLTFEWYHEDPANIGVITFPKIGFVATHTYNRETISSPGTIFSSVDDGRIVSAKISTVSSTAITPNTIPALVGTSVDHDTHTVWNGQSGFIVPISGTYIADVVLTSDTATPHSVFFSIDDTITSTPPFAALTVTSAATYFRGSQAFYLNAGQTIKLYDDAANNWTSLSFSLCKMGGSSQVLPAEKVSAKMYTVADQASPGAGSTVKLTYDTKEYDSHGAILLGSSRFIAPRTGHYWVTNSTSFVGTHDTDTQGIMIYKNGSFNQSLCGGERVGTSNSKLLSGTMRLHLEAGDYLELFYRGSNNSVGTIAGQSNGLNTAANGYPVSASFTVTSE